MSTPGFPAGNASSAKEVVNLSRQSAEELFNLAQYIFDKAPETPYEKYAKNLGFIYQSDPFIDGQGSFKTRTEADNQIFGNEMPEGAMPVAARFGIGRTISWSYNRYGNSFSLTWQAKQDNKYPQFVEGVLELPRMIKRRQYLDGTHPLTFCFASSYVNMDGRTVDLTGVDGLPIVSGSHTLPHSPDTWDNRLPGNPAVSQTALIAAERIFREEMKNGFGDNILVEPDTIVTSNDPDTVKTVEQLLHSTTEIGQDNPNVPTKVTKYRHIVLPYLDSDASGRIVPAKRGYWALVATGYNGVQAYHSLKEVTHMRPTDVVNANGDQTFFASGADVYRWIQGRGFVFSKGDASAWS